MIICRNKNTGSLADIKTYRWLSVHFIIAFMARKVCIYYYIYICAGDEKDEIQFTMGAGALSFLHHILYYIWAFTELQRSPDIWSKNITQQRAKAMNLLLYSRKEIEGKIGDMFFHFVCALKYNVPFFMQ